MVMVDLPYFEATRDEGVYRQGEMQESVEMGDLESRNGLGILV
jgi:hypothetical protein